MLITAIFNNAERLEPTQMLDDRDLAEEIIVHFKHPQVRALCAAVKSDVTDGYLMTREDVCYVLSRKNSLKICNHSVIPTGGTRQ